MIYTVTLNPALDRELTVPELGFDSVLRASEVRIDFGGKGFNVSRALASLGTESTALGFVGGPTGERIAAGLADSGIKTDFVIISGETRTNISAVGETDSRHIKINEAGPVISPDEAKALLSKIQALASSGDWWIMSGALPPGVDPGIYAEIVDIVHAAGGRALVDTSGDPLLPSCRSHPFLLKPNTSEAEELTGLSSGSPAEAADAAVKIRELGAQNVLLTLGRQGAVIATDSQTITASSPDVDEKNPIGAGDAAAAGLVYGLSRGLDWADSLRWSMACGAAAAGLPGTGMGSLDTCAALLDSVSVQQLY